ncbi:MAG: DNA repair exonuclease [Clostridiales bacterium]|nr:DNA repair exonuclease [Candidatus Equinaster intestinalis]
MNPIKIIHTADLHFGAEFAFLNERQKNQRKSELWLTFTKIIDKCIKEEADFLLIAGDVFDSNAADSALAESFFKCIETLPKTQVIAVTGNHDPFTTDSPYLGYPLPKNFHIIGSENVKIDFDDKNCSVFGSAFVGCYKEPQSLFSAPIDKSRINIAVIHGDINSGSKYNYISREFLENSGMNYVALGHIHKYTGIQKAGSTCYAYPGCPEPHGFDELGKKGVIVGNISPEKAEFEFVPMSQRIHYCAHLDISGAISNSDIENSIAQSLFYEFGEEYDKNLYEIILEGETEENFRPDVAALCSRFNDKVFFMKIKDRTTVKTNFELLKKEKSLKGEFARIMLEKIEAEPENEELKMVLDTGLKAFFGEVKYDEDK